MKKNLASIAGLALAGSILLSACGSTIPSENDAPKTSASSSTSVDTKASENAKPSNKKSDKAFEAPANPTDKKPEKIKFNEADKEARKGLGTPNTINLDAAFKDYAEPSVEKSFPKSDFDTKAGAKFGLSVMNDLIQTANLYEKRDGSKDFDLINTEDFTSRMTDDVVQGMKEDVATNKHLTYIPTALADGSIGYQQEDSKSKKVNLVLTTPPVSSYNTPAIRAIDNAMSINGERTIDWSTTHSKTVTEKIEYWVEVTPSGDSWLVSNMGWKSIDRKVSDAK